MKILLKRAGLLKTRNTLIKFIEGYNKDLSSNIDIDKDYVRGVKKDTEKMIVLLNNILYSIDNGSLDDVRKAVLAYYKVDSHPPFIKEFPNL